jgi:transcriptional regulator with XRE-family HTH domain
MSTKKIIRDNLFSQRLQNFIDEKKIKQKDMASQLGVTPTHVTNLLNGKREPSEQLEKLLERIISDNNLVSESPDPYAPGLIRPDEQNLLGMFRRLDDRHRENILEIMAGYEAQENLKKRKD